MLWLKSAQRRRSRTGLPVLSQWLPFPKFPRWLGGRRTVVWAGLTFAALALVAVMLSVSASREARRIASERFAFKAAETQFAIQQRLLAYEQVLRGGLALFATLENQVTREAWRTYVGALAIERNYPGIQGIGFSERILPHELAAHTARIRAEGFPEYAIRPDGERDEYSSIIFLEPFDWRNERAFGYDMFSEPVRQAAMARARDEAQPAVSGKVILVQETDQAVQNGFLMYLPVFRVGAALDTARERRDALLGYVYAPFRMHDLMQGILTPQQLADIRLEIFDGSAAAPEASLYDSLEAASDDSGAPAFALGRHLEIAGRVWTIRYTSRPVFDATIDRDAPQLILLGGSLMSLLFGAVVWSLSSNRERARQLVRVNGDLHAEIAERTKLEAELIEARDAAEAASRAKSAFLANMSHELRTPLNAVLGYAQMFKRDRSLNDWQTGAVNTIQQSGEHLLTLIGDILDLSKIEAGKLEVTLGVVALPELLKGVADVVRVKAEEKGLLFVCDLPSDLPTVVQADDKRLRQVLLNLLGNAVKFTDRGEVRFRIEHAASGEAEARLRVEVEDSGIGIPAEKLNAIFEPFEQVSDVQRRSAGTGLGLSITRQLLRLMGSDVQVESRPGEGSRFWFALVVPVIEATQDRRVATGIATGYLGPRRTVLIADDTIENRAVLSDTLRRLGFLTCEATNGQEALDLARSAPPDLILMDVMMPVMDGLEAMRRMRALPELRQAPIIAVSASVSAEDRARSVAAGADAFLSKPVDHQQLFQEIAALLALRWVQDVTDRDLGQSPVPLVAPPPEEIDLLYKLACAGDMRHIEARAAEIAARDGKFQPFANRLLRLAGNYDSKAIHDLIAQYLDPKRGAA